MCIRDSIEAVALSPKDFETRDLFNEALYNDCLLYTSSKGLVIIGDIKRGDIGSTSKAYAIGHVGKVAVGSKTYSGFCEDFVTVNPYLGSDGIRPFMEVCKEEKKGMFILVKTSNPSSGEFQDQEIDGKPLYEMVAEKVASWGEELMEDSYSYIGAVVGATYPKMGEVLRKIMPKSYILVPGSVSYTHLQKQRFFIRKGIQRSLLQQSMEVEFLILQKQFFDLHKRQES